MTKSKAAIKLGLRGAFIFQWCLCTQLGNNLTQHPSFEKKERGYTAYILLKRPCNKAVFVWSIFSFSVFINTFFYVFF